MRITESEVDGILKSIELFRNQAPMKLRLHGSRVDPNAKGGDIDLLLVVPEATIKDSMNAKKHQLLAEIKERIGDQKIDLIITTEQQTRSDKFLKFILSKSVELKTWK